MIYRGMRGAFVFAALLVGGCQTYQAAMPVQAAATPMDGGWASTDGVFIASFEHGNFTSRFTSTNEILAQGTYSVAGTTVSMQWESVATHQQRAAACTLMSADVVACNQQGGGKFELRRAGGNMPMAATPMAAPAAAGPPPAAPN